jgi:hypothetical protein
MAQASTPEEQRMRWRLQLCDKKNLPISKNRAAPLWRTFRKEYVFVMRGIRILSALLLGMPSLFGQQFSRAIEDNSFFIEEAYNQEYRVVQHISTVTYRHDTKDFIYSFTQEWPVGGQTHQLSFTIPYQFGQAKPNGFGDVFINYRYQLWDEHHWGWVAPRLSIILPTGNTFEGLGNGVVGFQLNLPVSKRWTDGFVAHFNAGATILPKVEGTTGSGATVRRTLPSAFIGASGIWLPAENFNILFEVLQSADAAVDENGNVAYAHSTIVSPGIRIALDIDRLQIVPGIAVPFLFGSGKPEGSIFGYLSFEHPF